MGCKKLKILFLTSWFPRKDNPVSSIFVYEHAKAISIYDNVYVLYVYKLVNQEKLFSKEYIEEDNLKILKISHKASLIPRTNFLLYLIGMIYGLLFLRKRFGKPDIIHANISKTSIIAAFASKLYRIPVILTLHETSLQNPSIYYKIFIHLGINHMNMILPVSKDLYRYIKKYGYRNKYAIIPNVVNTNLFYPKNKKKSGKIIRLLSVSALVKRKGLHILLQALKELQEIIKFKCYIIGEGNYRKVLENLINSYNLNNSVKLTGRLQKGLVAEYMRKADIFVHPSFKENSPCVLIEAMASGLPIIATDVNGIPEIMSRDNGILVKPYSAREIYDAILKLGNPDLRNRFRVNNLEKARMYSYKVVGLKLDNIYRDLINHEN